MTSETSVVTVDATPPEAKGAAPAASPLKIGQFNLPRWERYEAAMRDIFTRRWYTNQGPLALQLEHRLQAQLDVPHAVCVANVTIGLMMAFEALNLRGRVLVPNVCNRSVLHALAWCGLEAVFCDVDADTGLLTARALVGADDASTCSAIVAGHMWGNLCDTAALAALALARGVPLIVDASHAFGSRAPSTASRAAHVVEVYAFDEFNLIHAAGGACVATHDDELAARLRNIRSSYGAGRPVRVTKTSNGRMSEAQAAMGLLSLDDEADNVARNRALFDVYASRLCTIEGLTLVDPSNTVSSNYQCVVCAVDPSSYGESRDALIGRLAEHGIEAQAIKPACPAQDRALTASTTIGASWLLLPIGARISPESVAHICDVLEWRSVSPSHGHGECP